MFSFSCSGSPWKPWAHYSAWVLWQFSFWPQRAGRWRMAFSGKNGFLGKDEEWLSQVKKDGLLQWKKTGICCLFLFLNFKNYFPQENERNWELFLGLLITSQLSFHIKNLSLTLWQGSMHLYYLYTYMCVCISFHADSIKYACLSNSPLMFLRTLDFRWTLWVKIRIGLVKTVKPFNNLWDLFCGATIFLNIGPILGLERFSVLVCTSPDCADRVSALAGCFWRPQMQSWSGSRRPSLPWPGEAPFISRALK